jgi:hypothetical protein
MDELSALKGTVLPDDLEPLLSGAGFDGCVAVEDYYRVPDKERVKEKLVKRLQKLGYAVTVEVAEPAA